ncbi:MAG TPA: AAA family ATPase [Rhizomicrobium sp.]|nr:AAA family ATPase [Rhizomicrobium sp.]
MKTDPNDIVRKHGSSVLRTVIDNTKPESMREYRFKLIAFHDVGLSSECEYLIKGLIPRYGLTVVWGAPKSGKSFWTFDALMHVALGLKYRGRRVRQGPVVYCAFEGGDGFKKRMVAFGQHKLFKSETQVPFYLLPIRVDLIADHGVLIDELSGQMRERGHTAPAAIVLDTLNRSLTGSESSDQDMSAYVRAADALREAFGCAVIVVHHCGINDSRPRGHTSLTGAADAQLAVKRNGADHIIVTVEWMKDGPEGDEITSTLVNIELGTDEDGEPITTCILEPAQGGSLTDTPTREKLTKAARTALNALREAITDSGSTAPPETASHIPSGTRVTTFDTWRKYAYQRGISTSGGERAKQQAFKRATEHLIAAGEVIVWEPYVWTRA